MMMMGAGALFMLMFALVVIGLPILILALVAGGGLSTWLNSISASSPPAVSTTIRASAPLRRCPACGREVQSDWKVCPSCGAALS